MMILFIQFMILQVYVKNNIFKIPANILLPEDKVRKSFNILPVNFHMNRLKIIQYCCIDFDA